MNTLVELMVTLATSVVVNLSPVERAAIRGIVAKAQRFLEVRVAAMTDEEKRQLMSTLLASSASTVDQTELVAEAQACVTPQLVADMERLALYLDLDGDDDGLELVERVDDEACCSCMPRELLN